MTGSLSPSHRALGDAIGSGEAAAPAEQARARPAASLRKPKVLVLTSTFPRWESDTEPRFVLDLCRHLSPHLDVLVLAPHTQGAALAEDLEGVPVRRFRYFFARWQAVAYSGGILMRLRRNPWRLLQLPLFLVAAWWATRRLVRAWRPDVIHAHWIIPQGLVACLAAPDEIPIVCTSHGGDLNGLQAPCLRALKAIILRRCRAITVVSKSMVAAVRDLAADRPTEVAPMGTEVGTLFVPPPPSQARDRNHLLFVGRLVEKKGLRRLLRACAAVAPDVPDIRLTIAGDGPLKDELRELTTELGMTERVTFLGSVPHASLPGLYQRASVAVFPSDEEGFGLVVVEALGCGCPVIASDLPAIRERIEHGFNGVLTPAGDTDALADAIRSVLLDASLRETLARNAPATTRELDWESVAARYKSILYRVADR